MIQKFWLECLKKSWNAGYNVKEMATELHGSFNMQYEKESSFDQSRYSKTKLTKEDIYYNS